MSYYNCPNIKTKLNSTLFSFGNLIPSWQKLSVWCMLLCTINPKTVFNQFSKAGNKH